MNSLQLTLMVRLEMAVFYGLWETKQRTETELVLEAYKGESRNDTEYVNLTLNNLQCPQGLTDFVSTSSLVFVTKATRTSWAGRFFSHFIFFSTHQNQAIHTPFFPQTLSQI